jgi:hypothetical protein
MVQRSAIEVAQRGRGGKIVDVESLAEDAGAAIALVGPRGVVADSRNRREQIDVAHYFGIHDSGHIIDRNFAQIVIEAHLVRADEHIDAGARLLGQ